MDAHAGVHDLLHRYCRLADQGRMADIARLFTDDGIFEIGGELNHGPVAIESALARIGEKFAAYGEVGLSLRHHLTTVTVRSEDGSRAETTAYVLVVGRDGLDHWGHYRDSLVNGQDGWRIAHRRARTDGACPGSVVEYLVGLDRTQAQSDQQGAARAPGAARSSGAEG